MPLSERPRERLIHLGASALSNSELLAIIISKGYKGNPATWVAQNLISEFGDIYYWNFTDIFELKKVKGLGLAKVCQLFACFELAARLKLGSQNFAAIVKDSKIYLTSNDYYELVKSHLYLKDRENFILVSLDSRRRLIAVDNVSIGTLNQSLVHPREVFKLAISRRACYLILAHNHPSGDPSPSDGDIIVTKRLVGLSHEMGIPILDHLIVSDNSYFSFIGGGVVL